MALPSWSTIYTSHSFPTSSQSPIKISLTNYSSRLPPYRLQAMASRKPANPKLFQKLCEEGGDIDDMLMKELADTRKWKRCPYCKIYVEKIGGCHHVTCRCGSEFCYDCGSKWVSGHSCCF